MYDSAARLAKARASIVLYTHLTANTHPYIILQDEFLVLIRRRVIYRFVLPHNYFDQFFIHDCFELHITIFRNRPTLIHAASQMQRGGGGGNRERFTRRQADK